MPASLKLVRGRLGGRVQGAGVELREELVKGYQCLSICPLHFVDPSFWSPGALSVFQSWRRLSRDREKAGDLSDSHTLEHCIHNNKFQSLQRANILTSLLVPKIPLIGGGNLAFHNCYKIFKMHV